MKTKVKLDNKKLKQPVIEKHYITDYRTKEIRLFYISEISTFVDYLIPKLSL